MIGRRYARPPEGVRFEYPDGTRTGDLPLVYLGVDDEGLDVWEVLAPDHRLPARVHATRIPPRSSIVCGIEGGDE
jgi:hypothetical protein